MNWSLEGVVKSADDRGNFEVVASTDSKDRDGEVIIPGAFLPLPEDVPIHAFHDFSNPVGRGVPRYHGNQLLVTGKFASTARAQEIRALVMDGVIKHTSVGFMEPTREHRDGVTHITKAELLEVSFCSISSNRDARVLAARAYNPGHRGGDEAAFAALKVQLLLLEADLAALGAVPPPVVSRGSAKAALAEAQAFLRELES